ncbi:hypothetical protein STEG23_037436 [Scotinomys teguina]
MPVFLEEVVSIVKAKALKAKKTGQRNIHINRMRSTAGHSPLGIPGYYSSILTEGHKPGYPVILRATLITEHTVNKTEDNDKLCSSSVFNKHRFKQSVEMPCQTDVAKVNTLLWSDGRKKANDQLTSE